MNSFFAKITYLTLGTLTLGAVTAGLAHGDVITDVNSQGTATKNDPGATSYFVNLVKPGVVSANPWFRFDSLTLNNQKGGGNPSVSISAWSVAGGVGTQIGSTLTTTLANSGSNTIDLTSFGYHYYVNIDSFVLEIDINSGAKQLGTTTNLGFNVSDTSVVSSASFVGNHNGGGAAPTGNVAWLNLTASSHHAPEPGTLAALSGAGGWWVRRKKKGKALATSETGSETPPSAV